MHCWLSCHCEAFFAEAISLNQRKRRYCFAPFEMTDKSGVFTPPVSARNDNGIENVAFSVKKLLVLGAKFQ